ncbi:MAG: glycosyltransferase family 4 protein [Chloroflexota bacterium]
MNEIRVAIDLRLAAYRAGGIARYGVELSRGLRQIPGVTPLEARSRKDRIAPPGSLKLWTPPHHHLERVALGGEMLFRRRRWDVYHAPDFIVPHLHGAPAVATVHDLNFLDAPDHLTAESRWYYRQLFTSIDDTDLLIVPSEWTASRLSRSAGIDRDDIVVVPHGVPSFLAGLTPTPRSSRSNFLLAVGTIEPRKNYDLLLDALADSDFHRELIIVGGVGWEAEETRRRIESTPNVTWLRQADDRLLRHLYRDAIAVLVPSFDEGFGFSALEGMAAGTPVISSGRGALPEVTGGGALTVASSNPHDWSDAIERVVSDSAEWSRLSGAGIDRSRAFTWKAAAESTLSAYLIALESH